MKQTHLIIAIVSLVLACSDEQASGPADNTNCPEGQRYNAVQGRCVATTNTEDTGQPQTEDMGEATPDLATVEDTGTSATDQGVTEDLGAAPDLGKEVDMGAPGLGMVRFVAIGDVGTGSQTQIRVGQSIGTVCTALGGCDFGVLLGDNVYDSGVDSVNDSRFDSYFVIPYGHLQFPFYAVLGNHDLGGDGLGIDLDFQKGNYQVEYSNVNPMWKMPAKHYQVTEGPIWLVGLNTTDIFFDQADDQKNDVLNWLASSPNDRWKIAMGHHPYISNGPHGNAGEYEGLPFVPIANGKAVKDFMDDALCGKFDVYLCGHDHSRQDLQTTCGTEFIVSGAGAKTTDLEGNNPVHFESDTEGFLLVEATQTTLGINFYDENGVLEHQRMITR